MGTLTGSRLLRLIAAVVLFVAPFAASRPVPAAAVGPWYVAPGGSNGGDCLSPATACATLNGVIAKASAGETILVAEGTYTGSGDQVAQVDKSLTLSGGWTADFSTQTGMSTVDGQGVRRGMHIISNTVVSLDHFVVQNGFIKEAQTKGAGLWNQGSLTISESIFQDNIAWYREDVGNAYGIGGHLYNSGTLTLTNSVLRRSQGVYYGGAVANVGQAIISDTLITLNDSEGAILSNGDLTLQDTQVTHHWGYGFVGAVGHLSVVRSTFAHSNGGISILSGVASTMVLTVTASTISHNDVGISLGAAGGSITANFENTTISDNISVNDPNDPGGGLATSGAVVTISNSTLSGNAGSIGGITRSGSGTVTVRNTILAGNADRSGVALDCAGTLVSGGYNLVGSLNGCTFASSTGDLIGAQPELGPLMGEPAYRPLAPTSAAVDAGNPGGCQGATGVLAFDQRNAARDVICDIGAYEYAAPGAPASIIPYSGTPQHAVPDQPFSEAIQAIVFDSAGSPVPGVSVTFEAPALAPSMVVGPGGAASAMITTSLFGLAAPPFQIGGSVSGSFVLSATVPGVIVPALFELGNVVWYVTVGGIDADNCRTPLTACGTVEGALAKPSFLPGDTIWMGSGRYTGTDENVLDLHTDVTIVGGWNAAFTAQTGASVIDGEHQHRGVFVEADTVVLDRLTLTGGDNTYGGALYGASGGHVTLKNSVLTDNDGGVVIGNAGTLVISDTVMGLTDDTAIRADGPGYLLLHQVTVTETQGNAVEALHMSSWVTVTASTLTGGDNSGLHTKGSLFLSQSSVTGYAKSGLVSTGRAAVADSVISGNSSVFGAGIANTGTMTVTNSSLYLNTAVSAGGAISNTGHLTLIGSSIYSNTAGSDGGGLYNLGGNLVLSNTTVSGNQGAIGGGLYQSGGSTLLNSSTVAYNTAASGGGGLHNNLGTVTLRHAIVAANVQPSSPDCKGTYVSGGYNLIQDTTGCTLTSTVNNLLGVDPLLRPLAGSPAYHGLLRGSLAIDAGHPAAPGSEVAACPVTDQRGQARPLDGDNSGSALCDIGAVEEPYTFLVFGLLLRR